MVDKSPPISLSPFPSVFLLTHLHTHTHTHTYIQVNSEARKLWDTYALRLETVDYDPHTGSEVVHWVMKYPVSICNIRMVTYIKLFPLSFFLISCVFYSLPSYPHAHSSQCRIVNTCLSGDLGSVLKRMSLCLSTG